MAEAPVEVEVKGGRELQRGAARLFSNIDDSADAAFTQTADRVAAMVRSRVPRLTGALAGSVTASRSGGNARAAIGGPGVPYAGWIEFGGTRGRPYVAEGRWLFPTARDAAPEFRKAGEDTARKEIGRMRWPTPTAL